VLVTFWWSQSYWKYVETKFYHLFPVSDKHTSPTGENIVNEHTFTIDKDNVPQPKWVSSTIPVFRKMTLPPETVEGINRLMHNPQVLAKIPNNRILNFTELTPLGYIMGFQAEKGSEYPLWYHLGVGMFNKQKDMYIGKIKAAYYDVVLFEHIPTLNNFYPFEIRDTLQKNYQLLDSFAAPRVAPNYGTIEVYISKNK